jgi:hypothetical protein
MKRTPKLILALALCAGLALSALLLSVRPGLAQSPSQGLACEKFIGGGSYTLHRGETLPGNLCLLGGVATIEEGAVVQGEARVMGGALNVRGLVDGDIIAASGAITLGPTAVVTGDIALTAASLNQAQGARVEGRLLQRWGETNAAVGGLADSSRFAQLADPLLRSLFVLFLSFVAAGLGLLVMLFFSRQVERTVQAFVRQPLITLGMGLLTALAAPVVFLVVAITLVGIPLSVLGVLAVIFAWAFGMLAIGAESGKRLAALAHLDLAPPVQAAIGVFLLTLLVGLVWQIPCLGWLVGVLVGMVGLGAVLLTLFGTRDYPPLA